MRNTAVLAVIALLLAAAGLAVVQNGSEAWIQDKLNKTKDSVELIFGPGGGEDDSATISLPDGVPVYNARLGVRGADDGGGNYPKDLWVDVGRDGDVEWMYSGTGYGKLGKQYMFTDNSTFVKATFRDAGANDSYGFYLPKDAVVTKATVDITGAAGMNDGVMIKHETGAANALVYSSNYWTDASRPKLTINYAGGGSTVIQPDEAASKDARAQLGQPDANFEMTSTDRYIIYSWTSGSDSRGFLEFDLSSVPPNPDVTTATLDIWHTSYATGQTYDLHEVTGEWEESTLTWNNMPSFNPTPEDSDVTVGSQGVFNFDVTDLVGFWLSDQHPADVEFDVGMDGSAEYEMTGTLDTTEEVDDFSAELNSYLQTAGKAFTDDYGNAFVRVPMEITSTALGYVQLDNLSIEYDWTASIHKNPHNFNLTNELNEHMDEIAPVGGSVVIPLSVNTGSAGKVVLEDLNITYNGPPKLATDIPSDAGIDEEASEGRLLDLADYFADDFRTPRELEYSVIWNSEEALVEIEVAEGHYLSVDATGKDAVNYFGNITVQVQALDDLGFKKKSNQFHVNVWPVNDEPVKGTEPLPDLSLSEGGWTKPLQLAPGNYFHDVEDDELWFRAEVDPLDMYQGEDITVGIDNMSKTMKVYGNGDFFGDGVPVWVYCDDDPVVDDDVHWALKVDVANVNDDPPVWDVLPTVHFDEDTRLEDAFNVRDLVTDVDNDVGTLRYTVLSGTNDTQVEVGIDDRGFVDLWTSEKHANWTGESTVELQAADDGGNKGRASFRAVVDPVNDLPVVGLISPATEKKMTAGTVVLEWEAVDAETPANELTYSIYMGEGDVPTPLAEGLTETSYALEVQDGREYRWTVTAHDGTAEGPKARPRTFSVDFGAGPRAELLWPRDGMVLTGAEVLMSWELEPRPSGAGGEATYDVYMGTGPDALEKVATGLTATGWTDIGLTDGTTYYWTVTPTDGLGTGTCTSGVWSFTMDAAFPGYGVGLKIDQASITLEPGDLGVVTVTVENPGTAPDEYTLTGELPEVAGSQMSYGADEPEGFLLEPGALKTFTVALEIPGSTAEGTYRLTMTATSVRGALQDTGEVSVKIGAEAAGNTGGEGRAGSAEEGGLDTMVLIMIIVLVAAIVAVVIVAAVMNRKKSQRLHELEVRERSRKAAVIDAQLTVAAGPGLAGAAGDAPQLGTGAPAAGAGTAAGGAPMLALPKAATGGGPAPPSAAGDKTIDVTPEAAPAASGASKPAGGAPKPVAGASKPIPGAPTPSPGEPTPSPGAPTPAPGAPKPSAGAPTPVPAAAEPTPGAPSPSPGAPQPGPGAPKPPGAPGPAGDQPKPPAGKPPAKTLGTLPSEKAEK